MFVKVASALMGTLLLLQHVNGQSCVCKCGPTGLFGAEDLCSSTGVPSGGPHSGPLVVRPKALPKPTISLPLFGSSAKGPCFRRQAIVKPAVVPRPVYVQSEAQTCTSNVNMASAMAAAAQILSQNGCSSSSTHFLPQGFSDATAGAVGMSGGSQCQGIDVSRAYEQALTGVSQSSAPADAVSLAIAYKLSQNNYNKKIAEDRLAYGFRKLPVELPVIKQKVFKNVLPEQSLYALNGQIVELKPVSEQPNNECLAEEAEEELLDLALSEEANDLPVARRPSLSELGYGPAKISSPTFVEVPSISVVTGTAKDVAEAAVSSLASAACNDGFKSGTVEYKDFVKDFAKYEKAQHSLIDDTSCESQEEAVKHYAIPAPSCQCNYNGNLLHSVTHHAKSSSSASSASHKSVVLQKLCN